METQSASNGGTGKTTAPDASLTGRVVAAVCERLTSRRIGFLWSEGWCDPSPAAGFTWVHYAKGAQGTRRYDLDALARPDLEARTLDMLIVSGGSVPVLAELVSGLLVTPAAALIDGALRTSVPVLFETSNFLAWYASAHEPSRKSLLLSIEALRQRGAEFIGFARTPGVEKTSPKAGVVDLCESGWLSWSDIAGRLGGAQAVQLGEGTRLTPEARDRLMNLKIRIVEGGL